ncbi:FAD-dependent oxidoreductase [Adlercreutzia sp. ZJ304]|uniref:FAD-dependent oxidoreductase n=1 Tax=Adlercreutzia sp. ZJ304 TaxID=2709791 RepID=UPI0013EB11B0|nr:FAD-dependent oxidoreductase [Adlercreutzia sp. ZJ304]
MADFDAIIVGSGCAGPIAAYELAKAGKTVLVVERGNFAGAKNMTGGRIYAHSIKKVFPNFEKEAPVERRITRERISLMAPDSNFTFDFTSNQMGVEGQDSYSVLRGPFDQWLASKAEEAGAEYIYGIGVQQLVKDESGKVCGIRAEDDEITAEVTILCDGVNSVLAHQAVDFSQLSTSQVAVGIKQVFALPADVITNRVLAASDTEGTSWLFAGDATKGLFGGGFMYTNRNSISLGIVAGIEAVASGIYPISQMMEDFKAHPDIAALIKGGEMVEHSGHMVPEGGLNSMPPLVGDGVMLAGDSAMMCVNLGYVVRGMDYAIAAGQMAGQAAVRAIDKGDTSVTGLQCYVDMLKDSFVLKDFEKFSNAPTFMGGFNRMFAAYPTMIGNIMNGMFVIDGQPICHVRDIVKTEMKEIGVFNLLKDARGALKAL